MVKLTKIYTRTGDSGTTGLGSGERTPKNHPRVVSYGSVDEANAVIGVAVTHAKPDCPLRKQLTAIQHDLFDLGADLCTPVTENEDPEMVLRITQERIDALEAMIDDWNAHLESLTSFVLPGGTHLGAALHVARTVCRRAERDVLAILEQEPERTSGLTLMYLNRLSDLLFVMARVANDFGKSDVLWVPGKNRNEDN